MASMKKEKFVKLLFENVHLKDPDVESKSCVSLRVINQHSIKTQCKAYAFLTENEMHASVQLQAGTALNPKKEPSLSNGWEARRTTENSKCGARNGEPIVLSFSR
jgi:hypothetical protein